MRVKGGTVTRRRHKKTLEAASGYRMTRNRLYGVAREAVMHAGQYSIRDRRHRLAQMRSLWITRLSAALKNRGFSYSKFIGKYNQSGVTLNRKMLSELAISSPSAFNAVLKEAGF